jgi:hypothetical protein
MERTATQEELETMARDIRAAADEYTRDIQTLRAKRRRLFETWANILDGKKAEQVRKQIYGIS